MWSAIDYTFIFLSIWSEFVNTEVWLFSLKYFQTSLVTSFIIGLFRIREETHLSICYWFWDSYGYIAPYMTCMTLFSTLIEITRFFKVYTWPDWERLPSNPKTNDLFVSYTTLRSQGKLSTLPLKKNTVGSISGLGLWSCFGSTSWG